MKKGYISALILLVLALSFGPPAQAQGPAQTDWSVWVGSHYTGLDQYIYKVAEFDRGVTGVTPEVRFQFSRNQGKNAFMLNGFYYDPKRLGLQFQGNSGTDTKWNVSLQSFYRQSQKDLMENLVVREAGNAEGTKPGGKMVTHSDLNPGEYPGYRKMIFEANFETRIPGHKNVRIFAGERSILEKGEEQVLQVNHCSTCHINSHMIKLDRKTHALTGGVEVSFGKSILSYTANYRQFKSDAGGFAAMYDTARHPVKGIAGAEFASREIFSGTVMPIAQYPETQKLAHTLKFKTSVGKARLLAQAAAVNTKNKIGNLNINDKQASVRVIYPVFRKAKMVANAAYKRIENDPVFIDLPPWREGRPGGGQNFDYWRYSNLTRTVAEANAELIYQPTARYRLGLLAGYNSTVRDDYPDKGGNFTTKTVRLRGSLYYRPSSTWNAMLRYELKSIDNPFSPVNYTFEKPGSSVLAPLPDNPFVYYFQRDELRYGNITNLPTMVNAFSAKLNLRPNQKVRLSAAFKARIGTNSDNKELSYKQTSYQPSFSISLYPNDKFTLFGTYSMVLQSRNGLAAVTMMDG
ncbi:MAG TPA: hypothetical protein ENJ23_01510 [Bacteroidetes bacterium]|nr:hypothetical protein [Bacteroidota bacterium]